MFFSCWSTGAQEDRTTVHARLRTVVPIVLAHIPLSEQAPGQSHSHGAGKCALFQGGEGERARMEAQKQQSEER